MKKPRKAKSPEQTEPIIEGIVAGEELDEEEVYGRAVVEWQKTARLITRRKNQSIRFERGPIAIAFVADIHLGDTGVDYERVFAEAQIIANTPGMYLMLDGDLVNNFVLSKLMHVRLDTKFAINEEWVLLKRYLQVVGHKLLLSVGGNHDGWSRIAGIDYFRDVMKSVRKDILYDTDDIQVNLEIGEAAFPLRLRHKWRSFSEYNMTHGIEKMSRFDGGFVCGIGAHTHQSGVVRGFNRSGMNGIAVLCGSYKVYDPFARMLGVPRPNGSTAMTVIFDEDGSMVGVEHLGKAAQIITSLLGGQNAKTRADTRRLSADRKSKKAVGTGRVDHRVQVGKHRTRRRN